MRHIAIFLMMLMITSFSYSQDTIPPSLLDIIINPNVVDVSDSSQLVNMTLSLADDISGIQGIVTTAVIFPNGMISKMLALPVSKVQCILSGGAHCTYVEQSAAVNN